MYKLLLCWRYLRTRYLALACIVSVLLGVATLIVVNSVMSGFSTKLRERLHGLLSDVLIEATTLEGFADPDGRMARIQSDPFLKDRIEAMSPTLEVFAMIQFRLPSQELMTKPVRLVGIDMESRGKLGGIKEYLVNPQNKRKPSFEIPPDAKRRYEIRHRHLMQSLPPPPHNPGDPPPPVPVQSEIKMPRGAIVGHLIASFRLKYPDGKTKEHFLLHPGDQVILTTVSGQRLAPVYDSFVVVDTFKSEMSEYDSNFVFVPLDYLQHLRTMQGRVTSIQIKLRDPSEAKAVVKRLQEMFDGEVKTNALRIETWEDKQSPLLQAISIEKGLLNVLLFLIIAVAGFGILAIFCMIVAEKTRDIGILKALGASNWGVMKIFLGYGLLLGVVGTGLGTALGLTLTLNINSVEQWLSTVTGQDIFPRDVYYFNQIPTDIQAWTVFLVNLGAVGIAVIASVAPALRAALLHPVRALRYE
ncbi:MAG: ABC transporter permease [Gemmataceae bacterium]|nr:ABC transporter permease [Gemmataceae bacterium]